MEGCVCMLRLEKPTATHAQKHWTARSKEVRCLPSSVQTLSRYSELSNHLALRIASEAMCGGMSGYPTDGPKPLQLTAEPPLSVVWSVAGLDVNTLVCRGHSEALTHRARPLGPDRRPNHRPQATIQTTGGEPHSAQA